MAELAGAAAHELNQPLTSVMGYTELLKRTGLEEAPHERRSGTRREVIFNEAERMAEIVRKIGKITKYETKSYVGRARILDLGQGRGGRRGRGGGAAAQERGFAARPHHTLGCPHQWKSMTTQPCSPASLRPPAESP